jgi:hypothetical protein
MPRLFHIAVFLGVLVALAVPDSYAQGWSMETIHPFGNHADLAVDSLGHPHIVFNNCTAWETCEPDGPSELTYGTSDGFGWRFESVASDPAGFLTSILVDDGRTPHIAYCDSSWQMHYGFRAGNSWAVETLNHVNPPYYRASPSLALDADGDPHMAFIERETVRYACKVGGLWTDEHVTGAYLDNWSARAAIAVDSQGSIRIGTRQYYASANYITLEGDIWTSELIGGAIGYNPWMVLDNNDFAHFAYHGSGLYYATNASGGWVEEMVDPGGTNEDSDIALDASGRPFLIYTNTIMVSITPILYDLELFLSWPEDSGWVMEKIDSLSSDESPSMSPRLEIDAFGTIHVLYRRGSSGELLYGTRPVPSAAIDDLPARFADSINGVTPNPFNPVTEISFRLDSDEHVTLVVYDLSGRRVRNLLSANMRKGEHALVWDGNTDVGKGAPSGVYFFRLQTAQGADIRRGVLIK